MGVAGPAYCGCDQWIALVEAAWLRHHGVDGDHAVWIQSRRVLSESLLLGQDVVPGSGWRARADFSAERLQPSGESGCLSGDSNARQGSRCALADPMDWRPLQWAIDRLLRATPAKRTRRSPEQISFSSSSLEQPSRRAWDR